MADINSLGLDLNPSIAPAGYPGAAMRTDSLMVGRWLYSVHLHAEAVSWLDGKVDIDGGPLSELVDAGECSIEEALSVLEVPGPESRRPILAIGSNASPGQLRHKYKSTQDLVIPVSIANVSGVGVGHSAHVSKPGYIPYAPFRDADQRHDYHIQWLTQKQIEILDATEPNYVPLRLNETLYSVEIGPGIGVSGCTLYLSKWGVLYTSGSRPIVAGPQENIYSVLFGFDWFRRIVPEWQEGLEATLDALGRDEGRRRQVRESLARHGLVAEAGLS